MNKLAIFGIIALVIIGGVYFLLSPPSATAALLYIEEGTVQVDTGNGWQQATDEMELSKGAKVKTTQGQATIVFYEGEIMHLEPESEVEITQLTSKKTKVTQTAGETWNKITKISGMAEFTVETPNTVATVRGTEFILTPEELAVIEGAVEYGPTNNPEQMIVNQGKYAKYLEMNEEDMIEELRAKFSQFPQKYTKILQKIRTREIRKHKTILKMAADRDFTEEKIQAKLTEIDQGADEDKAYEQVPSPLKPKAKRTYLLTKEIKRALRAQR